MNDIKQLIEIIEENGGSATFDSICSAYATKYKVFITDTHKQVIRETLNHYPDLVKRVNYKDNEIYKLVEDEVVTFLRKLKNKCSESNGDGNWCKQHCPLNLDEEDYCAVMVIAQMLADRTPGELNIDKVNNVINSLNLKKGDSHERHQETN